jgi:glycosyltransferase involved in cell wall biosynthesis
MSVRGRVCFFAPYVYPITASGEVELVGGGEVILWSLARGLAARGFEVSIATGDFGQPTRVLRDGVTLVRTFSPEAGVRVVRFFYPRLWKSMSTLWRERADIYIAQGSGLVAGLAYDAAQLRHATFVFLAAHDFDALRALPFLTNGRDRWWYERALRGADMRIAQTEVQRRLFLDNFALETTVLGNPVEIPARVVDPGANAVVLWLATYKPAKRPEWFTELARRLPDHQFVMVGGLPPFTNQQESWEAAKRAANECPNLSVHGFVPRERIADFLEQAALFVHTSPAEGFPMSVLEAWSYGIPSVTSVDPDGSVARFGLGDVVTTVDDLVESVVRLMSDAEQRRATGASARAYVEHHHAQDSIYDRMASLLDPLVVKVKRQRRRGRNNTCES